MTYSYHKEWVQPHFDTTQPIMFDTETSLQPFGQSFGGKTRLIQLTQNKVTHIYDTFYINIDIVKDYLKDCHLVAHNIHYDLSCLEFQNWIPREIDDTMYLARHMFPTLESYSLKNLLAYLNIGDKGDEGASNWDSSLSKEQLKYAADDTIYLEELYEKLRGHREMLTYKIDIASITHALRYQLNGFPVIETNRKKMLKEKNKIVVETTKALPVNFNVNSYVQVRKLLNSTESDDNYLQKSKDPNAAYIRDQRKALKAINFLEKFEAQRIYGFFQSSGAITGRWTCRGMPGANPSSQNLQQLPREMKSIFGYAEDDGRYLVDADFTSLEVYTAAGVMGATDIVDVLLSGKDFHTTTASMMYKVDYDKVTKDQRQGAKVATFAYLYGAGKVTGQIMYLKMVGEEITETQAQDLKNKWLGAYSQVSMYHKKMSNKIGNLKPNMKLTITTPLGRPVSSDKYTDAINLTCQSTGTDCPN